MAIFNNDVMLSQRSVENVKSPGRLPYSGLVYVGGDTDGVHVMCHELAHILGAVDTYGIFGTGQENLNTDLSLMSGGPGNPLVHLDAWHKLQFGWSEPRIRTLNGGGRLSLSAAQLSQTDAPLLLYDTNRGTGEFFLLEYRTTNTATRGAGYDRNVGGNGVVLWHVAQNADHSPRYMAELMYPAANRNWQRCVQCNALFQNDYVHLSTCPASGGRHDPSGATKGLGLNDPTHPGQSGWLRCTKCEGLFWGAQQTASRCPEGGRHTGAAGENYTVNTNELLYYGEANFRRCDTCQVMFCPLHPEDSVCPGGGQHAASAGDLEYFPDCFFSQYALQNAAPPNLRHGGDTVWTGDTRTPRLSWYDGTPTLFRLHVHPFALGADSLTVDWLHEADTWVQFIYAGTEAGTFAQPFNTFAEGIAAATHGGTVKIKAGTSSDARRVTKRMNVAAHGGTVRIGQ